MSQLFDKYRGSKIRLTRKPVIKSFSKNRLLQSLDKAYYHILYSLRRGWRKTEIH